MLRDSIYDRKFSSATAKKQCAGMAEKPICTNTFLAMGKRLRCDECQEAHETATKRAKDQKRKERRRAAARGEMASAAG